MQERDENVADDKGINEDTKIRCEAVVRLKTRFHYNNYANYVIMKSMYITTMNAIFRQEVLGCITMVKYGLEQMMR